MAVAEYQLLGNILLITVVSFFGVALPGYALVRKKWPESGWNLGGSVSGSVMQSLDLVVAGGLVMMFVANWKIIPEAAKRALETEMTAQQIFESSVLMLCVASIIPLVLFWRVNLFEFFGLRWLEWKRIFIIVPCFVVGMFFLGGLLATSGWEDWVKDNFGGGLQDSVKIMQETKDPFMIGAMLFAAVIVAPIAEELMFRGYLYPLVKRYADQWFATVFVSLLFGVVHFNLMGFPMLALMGVILVVLYEWSGSIWVPIGCHMAFNATSMALIFLIKYLPPAT